MTGVPSDEETTAIEALEEIEIVEDSHNESPPSDIVAYNELRSCADLFRMAEDGNLVIQPDFQRDFIWKGPDQTRFIDSLIKQLPVPSMCFAFDFKQNLWIVIDGLQRISTIKRFLSGEDWTLAKSDDIDPILKGKNAATIKTAKAGELKTVYNRVQNQTLPVNIIRCDLTKRSHNEYIFTIFHRLNSGGVKLNNQEIRNCIYSGDLNTLIRDLDKNSEWRRINHMTPGNNYRFTKQETILRFFAFRDRSDKYKGSISKFLNDYMFDCRSMKPEEGALKRAEFEKTIQTLSTRILKQTPPPRLPATVLEAAMLGIAENQAKVDTHTDTELQSLFNELRGDQSLSAEFLAEGLSKPEKVTARLAAARTIFAK